VILDTAVSPKLCNGKRFIPPYVGLQNENASLKKKLYREQLKTSKLAANTDKLTKLVGIRTKDVLKENVNIQKNNDKLKEKLKAVHKKQRCMIPRDIHESVKKSCELEQDELRRQCCDLRVERDHLIDENDNLRQKMANVKQKNDVYRKQKERNQSKVKLLNEKAMRAKEEYRTDKEATELYYQAILEKLCSEVNERKKTADEMESEINNLKKLETKVNGMYNTNIRLLYYDLLCKGVPANVIQSVVTSVIENLTQCEVSNLKLPSRSSAQRMVLEAGELAKIRTVMELSSHDGDLGHHSDGTTKSLIHWGTHILKLSVDNDSKAFTLGVQPVPSGKACDTVADLQQHFQDLRDVADMMGVEYSESTFSTGRVGGRMSDGAANELSDSRNLMEERSKICEQSED
jgi:hypothetical protein